MNKFIIQVYMMINMVIFFYVILSSMNSRHQAIILMAMGLINFGLVQLSDYLDRKKVKKESKVNI